VSELVHAPEVAVSVAIERVPMSFEAWRALPDRPKAEWVDGVAVIYMAPPFISHGRAHGRLTYVLIRDLPGLEVLPEVDVALPRNRIRRPDLTVVDHLPADLRQIHDPAAS